MSDRSDCQLFNEYLMSMKIAELNNDLPFRHARHLEACFECRSLYQAACSAAGSTRQEKQGFPLPSPEVRSKLLAHLQPEAVRPSIFSKTAQALLRLFTRPVPVYQAMLAAAVLLVLFNLGNRNTTHVSEMRSSNLTEVSSGREWIPMNSNLPRLLEEAQTGINAREDTLFSRILFSAM